MANAADKMAVMTENLRDMGLDDESVAKCLQMVESGQYQALDCFLKSYHPRSLNSNGGWNKIGCMSFINMPILQYSNEIRSAVMIMHGDKAHSFYFGKDAYENMINGNKYTDNKQLLVIEGTSHTDLYDGGENNAIPFDKLEAFYNEYLI